MGSSGGGSPTAVRRVTASPMLASRLAKMTTSARPSSSTVAAWWYRASRANCTSRQKTKLSAMSTPHGQLPGSYAYDNARPIEPDMASWLAMRSNWMRPRQVMTAVRCKLATMHSRWSTSLVSQNLKSKGHAGLEPS